jgi:hypothetical protein
MREGIQTVLAELGEAACLALCICELGKPGIPEAEALGLILEGMDRGFIDYDEANRDNPDNCFVANRDAFMVLVTREKGWASTTEEPGYRAKPGERVIERWAWEEKTANKVAMHQHFRLKSWDPYRDSQTVKKGALESLRVFRKAA